MRRLREWGGYPGASHLEGVASLSDALGRPSGGDIPAGPLGDYSMTVSNVTCTTK